MKQVVIRVFILWSIVVFILVFSANHFSGRHAQEAVLLQSNWLQEQQAVLLPKLRHINWAQTGERRHVIAELSSLPQVVAVRVIASGQAIDAIEPSQPPSSVHTVRFPIDWRQGLVEIDLDLSHWVSSLDPMGVSSTFSLFYGVALVLLAAALGIHWWMVQPLLKLDEKAEAILTGDYSAEHFTLSDEHPLTSELAINVLLNEYQRSKQQQKELSNRLRKHSFVDELTGLGNREYFDAELEVHLNQQAGSVHGAVVLFSFEPLLELHHENRVEFNRLIKAVGDFFHRFVDEEDLCWVARRATVDFSLLTLENAPEKVKRLCQQIIRDLQRSIFDNTAYKNYFINVGITFFSSGESAYDVLASADMSLRHAQLEGANQIHMYTPKKLSKDVIKGSVRWRSFLQTILDRRKVTLYYQSQVSHKEPEKRCFEALSRIEDKGKVIAASVFLPMANRCGLASDFDRLIIDKALKEMTFGGQFSDVELSINIFSESLMNPSFNHWLIQRMNGLHEINHRIYFEISESAVSRSLDKLKLPIEQIAALGCHWCVEHVGSPNADLAYITELPLSRLKLGQATVRQIHQHPDKELFVQSLITAAHQAGLEVWAEGIESEEEWSKLVALGVVGGQGYWFGSPQQELFAPSKHVVNL
jgi:RNase E specificity factor CsrD